MPMKSSYKIYKREVCSCCYVFVLWHLTSSADSILFGSLQCFRAVYVPCET